MYIVDSPIGPLALRSDGAAVTHIDLCREAAPAALPEDAPDCVLQAARELAEYFAGTRKRFAFPMRGEGTPFQKQVWEALCGIPYGQTRTYGQIAQAVGRPKAARAVGMANHHNPLMIAVPCHRVVGQDGALTGYAGGLAVKAFLLALEKAQPKGRETP